MNKTRTNIVNRNIYLTSKCGKPCQAFFSCTFLTHNVHISSQLHFISVDSYRTFVREGPHLRNMRKYWKKFKKWLKYKPNKSYMRGNGISSSKLTPTKSTN